MRVGTSPRRRDPPHRRDTDSGATQAIGWIACAVLAISLTYMFVRTLASPRHPVDPLFFGLQTAASLFFLIYSIRLANRIFVTANTIALLNAAGTVLVQLVRDA